MPDRTTPHSLEAEKAALGAVLVRADAWHAVSAVIGPADFFRGAHRLIFEAMRRLQDRSVAIDVLTLRDDLSAHGMLDECGGPSYISGLTDGVPTATNAGHYATIVAQHAKRRKLVEIGTKLAAAAYDGEQPAERIADSVSTELVDVAGGPASGMVSASDAISGYVASVSAGTSGDVVLSGYADFDRLVGGFRQAELVIVAARPSVGKTSWALGAADAMAQAGGWPLFFSMEMSAHRLAGRLLSWCSGVQASRLERGDVNEDEYASVIAATTHETAGSLRIQETARTLTEVASWARVAQRSGGLTCLFVDYLQLMGSDGRAESRQAEVSAISRGLKRIAKDLSVPMVALSQLSRAPEDRRDKRPHMSDLRESGALEQDADMVVLLFREEMHKPTPENAGMAEVIVSKNRNGPVGVTRMQFTSELAQFRNLHMGGM